MNESTGDLIIYGASDDIIEIEGVVREEYPLPEGNEGRIRIVAPDGGTLDVVLTFGMDHGLDWKIRVETVTAWPSWPIRFHPRPSYEVDPAVTITVPEDTHVYLVGGEDK